LVNFGLNPSNSSLSKSDWLRERFSLDELVQRCFAKPSSVYNLVESDDTHDLLSMIVVIG
jgi:hypothetical protein